MTICHADKHRTHSFSVLRLDGLDLERELEDRDPPSKAVRVTFDATSLQQIKTSAKATLGENCTQYLFLFAVVQ